MIFISQSGLSDATREADWDRWYHEHLRVMATVRGISSAQRFKTVTPGFPPSLAIYSVESAAVFDDPYYRSVRGMGEWVPLIDRRYYQRNLFAGLDAAPHVEPGQNLLVADRSEPDEPMPGVEFTWLQSAGIDRSTPYRGLAVIDAAKLPALDDATAVYRPVTQRYTSTAR
jgi:hypothetical protein